MPIRRAPVVPKRNTSTPRHVPAARPRLPASAVRHSSLPARPSLPAVNLRFFATDVRDNTARKSVFDIPHDVAEKVLQDNYKSFAVAQLGERGLRIEDLQDIKAFDSFEHCGALEFLLKANHAPKKATAFLDQLSKHEAYGIRHGLSREEVARLNKMQIRAILELKKYGLKPEHLRDKSWFNSRLHVDALSYRITEQGLHNINIVDAIDSVHQLDKNKYELIAVALGLGMDSKKSITEEQVHTLFMLNSQFGVTAAELRNQSWFAGPHHYAAVFDLAVKYNHGLVKALDMLAKLNPAQHKQLEKESVGKVLGLSSQDVDLNARAPNFGP